MEMTRLNGVLGELKQADQQLASDIFHKQQEVEGQIRVPSL